ncbi:hypothetical protein DCAR_0101088 [Daucus carota subsp. sativus]|uniref:Replication factor A C-terminal domain-containing protein n=1 Tax=Daucus carota subsp. sativus TaxID=79200 RepID=A0A166G4R0_DAUCS|nr:hypothetical protein DCAR_0101088 [Daucus carota subsp. sativus]
MRGSSETTTPEGATKNMDPLYSTLEELVTKSLSEHQEFKCAVTMMEVLVPEHRTYVICNACTGIQNSSEENNYYAQCGRTNCSTIQKLLILVLVRDGEVLAKPLITGKALKQLTGMHIKDYINYYDMVIITL